MYVNRHRHTTVTDTTIATAATNLHEKEDEERAARTCKMLSCAPACRRLIKHAPGRAQALQVWTELAKLGSNLGQNGATEVGTLRIPCDSGTHEGDGRL